VTDLIDLASAFDGARWAASRVRAGLLDATVVPHGDLSRWMWDRTRVTLGYAMQGYRVKSRRAGSVDLEIETPADAGNFKIGMEMS
jgi:hypothetical protein